MSSQKKSQNSLSSSRLDELYQRAASELERDNWQVRSKSEPDPEDDSLDDFSENDAIISAMKGKHATWSIVSKTAQNIQKNSKIIENEQETLNNEESTEDKPKLDIVIAAISFLCPLLGIIFYIWFKYSPHEDRDKAYSAQKGIKELFLLFIAMILLGAFITYL